MRTGSNLDVSRIKAEISRAEAEGRDCSGARRLLQIGEQLSSGADILPFPSVRSFWPPGRRLAEGD